MPTTKTDHWRRHVRGWVNSGLSCKAYARRKGLNHHTLSWWKSRLIARGERFDEARPTKAEVASFVEVVPAVLEPASEERIAIDVAGATIRVPDGFSRQTLGDVLAVLGSR